MIFFLFFFVSSLKPRKDGLDHPETENTCVTLPEKESLKNYNLSITMVTVTKGGELRSSFFLEFFSLLKILRVFNGGVA